MPCDPHLCSTSGFLFLDERSLSYLSAKIRGLEQGHRSHSKDGKQKKEQQAHRADGRFAEEGEKRQIQQPKTTYSGTYIIVSIYVAKELQPTLEALLT